MIKENKEKERIPFKKRNYLLFKIKTIYENKNCNFKGVKT